MLLQGKAEFARAVNLSPGRITQMIADGIIGPDALEGSGRSARIRVEIARRQIAERRNPGQALGNGLLTAIDAPAPASSDLPSPASAASGAASDSPSSDAPANLARQLQEQKLEEAQRRNRIAARDEAVAAGQLVPADDVRAEMGRLAQAIEDENAGMLADFAAAIAQQFEIAQRDVLHLLRQVRTEKRKDAAERARARAAALPERTETTVLTAEEDPA